jgi:hypothetical protein
VVFLAVYWVMDYDKIPESKMEDYVMSLAEYRSIGTRLDDRLPIWMGTPDSEPRKFSGWNPWDQGYVGAKDRVLLGKGRKTKRGVEVDLPAGAWSEQGMKQLGRSLSKVDHLVFKALRFDLLLMP